MIRIPRTGLTPVQIDADRPIRTWTSYNCDANRWHEIEVYEVDYDFYVCHVGYRTTWPSENDHDWCMSGSADELITWLQSGPFLPDRFGFPPVEKYAKRQSALQKKMAAEWAPGVSAILDHDAFAVRLTRRHLNVHLGAAAVVQELVEALQAFLNMPLPVSRTRQEQLDRNVIREKARAALAKAGVSN